MRICAESECTGCSACRAACPADCIEMIYNIEGFAYPQIDESKCLLCGCCEAVCPINKEEPTSVKIPKAYGVMANDLSLRKASSSGGVFSLLAEAILDMGGVVFGAAMSGDCKSVQHIMVTNTSDLAALRGSKYLQSNVNDSFQAVKEQLHAGKQVLFSGTPCQIEGLVSFLGNPHDKLLCVDFICHGTPSPALWRKYVEHLEKKYHAPIEKVDFRNKTHGWRFWGARLENSSRKVLNSTLREDPYLQMFLQNVSLRPSCYQCHTKKLNRVSDITIADFWGVENVAPELDDNMGTSLVLVHSDKGKIFFNQISSKTTFQEVDCVTALEGNPCMTKSVDRPKERDTFFDDMNRMTFKCLQKKYLVDADGFPYTFSGNCRRFLRKIHVLLWRVKEKAKKMMGVIQ